VPSQADSLRGVRILVVEDEALIAEEIRERLARFGATVVGIADTGPGAIRLAREERPDLVLMDIRLKGPMSGIEASETIGRELAIPVVFLTAHSDWETVMRAKQSNPFGYVFKPFQETDLMATVQVTLHQAGLERQLAEREAHYRAMLEDQTEFIVRWRPDGERTYVNPAYARYFGSSPEALVGSSFFPMVGSDPDREAIRAKLAALTPLQPIMQNTHQARRADGQWRWQEWIDRGFFDEAGHLVELQSVGRDVHERVLAEAQVRERQQLLQTLLEYAPAPIAMFDRDMKALGDPELKRELLVLRRLGRQATRVATGSATTAATVAR